MPLTATLLLLLGGNLHLGLVEDEVLLHLLDSLVRDGEAKLLLGDGEVEPELAPGTETGLVVSCCCSVPRLLNRRYAHRRRRACSSPWTHSAWRGCQFMSLDEGSVAHEDRGVWYESMVVGWFARKKVDGIELAQPCGR